MQALRKVAVNPVRALSLVTLILGLGLLMAIAACSNNEGDSDGSDSDGASTLKVVTTTNIVADWVQNVGGDHVEVNSLLPVGGDPHTYQPGARDVARMVDADLVLTIGLNLEGNWLRELIQNASADESRITTLGEGIDAIEFAETGGHHGEEEDHEEEEEADEEGEAEDDHGPLDPHFWFDPSRVKIAVNDIAERLASLDPANADTYNANATAYGEELDELHAWTIEQLSVLPNDDRILVTSHDSLSYFAVVYGFEVVGTVIPGGATEAEPSAELIAELSEVVEHEGVKAVFGESTVTERIARAIAEETGAEFVSLYSGSLGPQGSGADTHIGMIRTNVKLIVNALS